MGCEADEREAHGGQRVPGADVEPQPPIPSHLPPPPPALRGAQALVSQGWGDEEALDQMPLNPFYDPTLYR